MKISRYLSILGLSCAIVCTTTLAEDRIALVIGNSSYEDSPLINPVNDAGLIASTLEELGFEVMTYLDVDQKSMKRAIQAFGDRLDESGKGTVGLFYYAGHGIQVGGENFLVPVNAEIARERDVTIEAVSASAVLATMEYARNELNFVIFDACRNNPFARSFRSAARGLARMDAPSGTLVAYATAPGSVAMDGEGDNSPYSTALVQAMNEPGLAVEQMFKRVRRTVMQQTSDAQVPWESSSLTGDFYFGGSDGTALSAETPRPSPTVAEIDREALFWNSIADSDDADDFREYLRQFPDGMFAGLARNRFTQLTGTDQTPEEQARAELVITVEDPAGAQPPPGEEPVGEAVAAAGADLERSVSIYRGRESEPNNEVANATPIENNSSIQARIDPAGDVDWYRTSVRQQGALSVNIGNVPPELDVTYRIWHQEIGTLSGWIAPLRAGAPTEGVVDLAAPGDYYIEVRDGRNDASSGQPFVVDTRFQPTFDGHEPNNNFGEAADIVLGRSWQATILPKGDVDWLRLHVDQHGELSVSITNVPANLDISARVWTGDKGTLTGWFAPLSAGGDTEFTVDLPAPGHYAIEVRDGRNDSRSAERFTVMTEFTPSPDAFEPNNAFGNAAALAVGETLLGTILPKGDADWYRVDVDEQGELVVNIHDVPENLDMNFRVWSADKGTLTGWYAPLSVGGDTREIIDLAGPGSYVLEVRDGSNDNRSVDSYAIGTSFRPTRDFAEPNNTFGVATPLKLGATVAASILPKGDADWYRISTSRSGNLKVLVSEPPENLDINFRVWNANKGTVSSWIAPLRVGGETQGEVALPQPGEYFIEVRDGGNDNRSVETYQIVASM